MLIIDTSQNRSVSDGEPIKPYKDNTQQTQTHEHTHKYNTHKHTDTHIQKHTQRDKKHTNTHRSTHLLICSLFFLNLSILFPFSSAALMASLLTRRCNRTSSTWALTWGFDFTSLLMHFTTSNDKSPTLSPIRAPREKKGKEFIFIMNYITPLHITALFNPYQGNLGTALTQCEGESSNRCLGSANWMKGITLKSLATTILY